MVVNILALLWGAAMMLNFLTPSSASSAFDAKASGANYLRIFSNPKAYQSDYYVQGHLLMNFHNSLLNKIPAIELFMGVVLIVGAIYYFAAQRSKPWEPVTPPDEDLTGIAPAAAS
jgi:hypothetical protein